MKPLVIEYLIEEMDPGQSNKVINIYVEKTMKDAKEKYDFLSLNNFPKLIYNLDIRVICLEPGIHKECIVYKGNPNLPF